MSSSAASSVSYTGTASGQNTIFQGLSLFRILLGALILFNFAFNLVPYFTDFFSDAGFYTRAMNVKMRPLTSYFSVLQWSDADWYLLLFQIVYGLSLVLFIIGYQTRIVKWVVFAGLMSLHSRNPMITYGADALMRVLLLWCLFLPLNRYWSVDSALSRAPRDEAIPAIFVASIKLQICMLYLFSAFFKLMGKPWLEGTGPSFAMHDGVQGTPFGGAVADTLPFLMAPLNYGIMVFQLWFSPLVYSPIYNNYARALALAGAFAMHVSFVFLLQVGVFPYICIFYLTLLIPDRWFNVGLASRRARLEKIIMYFDPGCGFCEKTARLFRELCLSPFSEVLPASADAEMLALLKRHNSWIVKDGNTGKIYMKWEAVSFVLRQNPFTWIFGAVTDLPFLKGLMRWVYELIGHSRPVLGKFTAVLLPFTDKNPRSWPLVEALCGIMIMLAFIGNVLTLPTFTGPSPVYKFVRRLVTYAMVQQKWDLFAPMTTHWAYGYEADGLSTSGQKVDMVPYFEKDNIKKLGGYYMTFTNHYWQKHFQRLYEKDYKPAILHTLQDMCETYNDQHPDDKLVTASLRLLRVHYEKVVPDTPPGAYSMDTVECGIR